MQAKAGDKVKLASGEGIFVDYETGFEVVNSQEKELGNTIGKRTSEALAAGGLVVVQPKETAKKAK